MAPAVTSEELRDAARTWDLARLQTLLSTATKDVINGGDYDGWTVLHYAAATGRTDCLKALLLKGADIEAKDNEGKTALHDAANNGKTACLEALLLKGANIEVKTKDGWTALHCAAEKGHTACLEALLLKGADIEANTHVGSTALHLAARRGQTACLDALLLKGADIEAWDDRGKTALDLAKERYQDDAVRVLKAWKEAIDKFAEPLCKAAAVGDMVKLQGVLDGIAKTKNVINCKDEDGNTALHYAARNGETACLKALLLKGANIEAKDKKGKTALDWAKEGKKDDAVHVLEAWQAKTKDGAAKTATPAVTSEELTEVAKTSDDEKAADDHDQAATDVLSSEMVQLAINDDEETTTTGDLHTEPEDVKSKSDVEDAPPPPKAKAKTKKPKTNKAKKTSEGFRKDLEEQIKALRTEKEFPAAGYVYIMKTELPPPANFKSDSRPNNANVVMCKIGKAADPDARRRQLQTAHWTYLRRVHPTDAEIDTASLWVEDALAIESAAHSEFDEYRVTTASEGGEAAGTEWFALVSHPLVDDDTSSSSSSSSSWPTIAKVRLFIVTETRAQQQQQQQSASETAAAASSSTSPPNPAPAPAPAPAQTSTDENDESELSAAAQ